MGEGGEGEVLPSIGEYPPVLLISITSLAMMFITGRIRLLIAVGLGRGWRG